jgi:hypothetical protein
MSIAASTPDWTEAEDRILIELYPQAERIDIQKAIPQRTWITIRTRARKLSVKRDPKFRYSCNIKSYRKPELTPINLGYTASFLDTEGSIGVNIEKDSWHLHPQVSLSNQCKEALDFIAERIGFGRVSGGGHDKMYRLYLGSYGSIIVFLETVLPHLIVKREKAQLMIEFCKSRVARLMQGKGGYSQEEIDLAKRLVKYSKYKSDEVWMRFS